ncbi:MAG: chitin synthase-domain-containing protein [Benjaminiella poitrasii]|nr:MAG: chitin synthase-domain-containing protein [Benjaminiella poitrasii]
MNNNDHISHPHRSISLRRNKSKSSQVALDGTKPRRQKSLVRPERERNDPNNRLYHYRQRATSGQYNDNTDLAPSTTGNQPNLGRHPSSSTAAVGHRTTASHPLERRPTAREQFLRRGKSILGREEKQEEEEEFSEGAIEYDVNKRRGCLSDFHPWLTYCRILTCCIPKPLLRCAGIPDGPAQMAWREKIGLVSFILFIMGCVGFLTFGFTQAVCPVPPLSVRGGQVSPGYLIIAGWAYMLASWEHPVGPTDETTNILYPPINAGGMDATFLFLTIKSECASVFIPTQGDQQIYFPCQLFNPNSTIPPDPSQFMNRTSCHLSATSHELFNSFQSQGVPRPDGGFDKAARVYYDWEDIISENSLTVYNGDVLNLKLLSSLPTSYYQYKPDGLVAAIFANMTLFTGRDITRTINANRANGGEWDEEAKCLSETIKVGSLDTISIGCMASDIVLYVSLVVILGVILVKFALAVIFGWFLSWKLGNFKEGSSYAERMKREAEIENWTANMQAGAPLPKARIQSTYFGASSNKRKSLFPQTSRFTQPMHGLTRFATDKPLNGSTIWKTPNSALENHVNRQSVLYGVDTASRQSSYMMGSPELYTNTSRASVIYNHPQTSSGRMFGNEIRRPSITSSDVTSTDTHSTMPACPLPLSRHVLRQPPTDYMPFHFPLVHTICLVTCYSEGEAGIRITLDSIATSDYANSHKLMLVICDGLVTGSGESKSTPEICVNMMRDLLVPEEQVQPVSYVALADGSRQNNMAKVYAGFYRYDDATVDRQHQQRVPMITIVKCGTAEERAVAKKPGNRGKRDSQIILMQFMQKVMFDERMTTMEYEFFNSLWRVTGVPPDAYEIVLMVDADTKLFPDALSRLISCAVKDPDISGLCGETKIANKTDSWVTMMQVFEYYISHHQSKAFESVFGGVTCLPGCFCMYRIKAPKGPDGYWVPILANPDIVERYSENIVDTLHKKNLLLLGEDRYLSTLMLRTFPNRKMVFVPQAVCKTVVPDTFMVLLSQRRRWINSTIHNLMELLFVHDLCGTFCFSMQFVIFMELVGTLALPAAISFTLYLIVMACLGQPSLIPLLLLAVILGLPAVLIVMTSRKVVYVGWMIVYLFSLPIWNFVLPAYAYWHFDDFSWGDTRKVEGAETDKKGGHADKEGEFDSSAITMKKWSEYEKERRIQEALDRNMPIPRFIDRPPRATGLDVFRDSALVKRYSKTGSAGSADSDVPLTQSGYPPAQYQKKSKVVASSYEERLLSSSKSSSTPESSSHGNSSIGGGEDGPDIIPLATLQSDYQESSSSFYQQQTTRSHYNARLNTSSSIQLDEDDLFIEEQQHTQSHHVWSDHRTPSYQTKSTDLPPLPPHDTTLEKQER